MQLMAEQVMPKVKRRTQRGLNMQRVLAIRLLSATECLGASRARRRALGHLHGWDWGNLLVWIAIAAVAALRDLAS